MILRASDGVRGKLIDLDTGKVIPRVIWANLETGEFEAEMVGSDGRTLTDHDGEKRIWWGRGRLKFEPRNPLVIEPPAPKPVPRPISAPLFSDRCGHYGCDRVATYAVSDEVPEEPEVVNGIRFARGRTVGRRFYCDWHYRGPRIYDHKGELIEEIEDGGGVRPE